MGTDVHALHSLSTYLGGFPPRVPRTIIQRWVPARASILDPFCGSGTTLVEAKLLGHPSVGLDLNPLAVAIARAKLQPVYLDDVLHRLIELARGFRCSATMGDVPDAVRVIYHERTLAQLCYLRGALDLNRSAD